MTERHNFTTGVGRFVSGSLTEKRATDNERRPIEPDKQRFEFGVAFPKTDQTTIDAIMGIAGYARNSYAQSPHIAQRVDSWMQTFTGFSMKISDGDRPNQRGEVNQNTAGHYVFWFSTSLDVNVCKSVNGNVMQIPAEDCKRGYYVAVSGNCAVNGLLDNNAGIYMNPDWIMLVAEGDQIVGGPTAEEAFGNFQVPTALPPGARPLGSAPAGLPGAAPALGNAPAMAAPTAPTAPTAPQVGATPLAPQAPALVGGLPQTPQSGVGLPAQPGIASPTDPIHPPHPGILGGGLPQ